MLNQISPRSQALLWCALAAMLGLSMLTLFKDGSQQDAPLHFLFARWAWKHPVLFVDVWSRPLYTLVYSFPALIDYRATRFVTAAISLAVSWQTWRLAEALRMERAPLSLMLVWLQPSFFLFSAENMTEPIFALVFAVAMRLHFQGRVILSRFTASLMLLARPEGFFLAALWALFDDPRRDGKRRSFIEWVLRAAPLATGAVLWWAAALAITGDPLFIKHNWPGDWPLVGTMYGARGLAAYPARLPEIVGVLLLPPFFAGLVFLIRRRRFGPLTSSFLLVFLLHTIFRAYGMLGSAGYPRYCVTVAPAIALITLAGWNHLSGYWQGVSRPVRRALVGLLLGTSVYMNFCYVDAGEVARDARGLDQMRAWFDAHPAPITRFIWSQPYAGIAFDRDLREQPFFSRDPAANLEMLRGQPPGTLVCWDSKIGPKWFGLAAKDFEAVGFTRLHSQSFVFRGYILDRSYFGFGGPREQTMDLLYKQ
jgi:hypothetical protein